MNNYCVFILSYGRPDAVITLKTLERERYSGEWYIVCSSDDAALGEYIARYGKRVKVFDREDVEKEYDAADSVRDIKTIFHARNACWKIAEELGYKYFIQLDDDYKSFEHRWRQGDILKVKECKNVTEVFDAMVEYVKRTGVTTIALAQGGDFIGGAKSPMARGKVKRKAMNSFAMSAEKKFGFIGRINEDVNTYVLGGIMGQVFLTVNPMCVVQGQTQKTKGGMTEGYLEVGTYAKSFFSVMVAPSCVKIAAMCSKHPRIHHKINWANCAVKIIREEYGRE